MNITEIKQKIENGAFDKDFTMLYGDVSAACARYSARVRQLLRYFPRKRRHTPFLCPRQN